MFSHWVLNRAAFPAHEGKVQHRIADFAKIKVGIERLTLVSRAWLIECVSYLPRRSWMSTTSWDPMIRGSCPKVSPLSCHRHGSSLH